MSTNRLMARISLKHRTAYFLLPVAFAVLILTIGYHLFFRSTAADIGNYLVRGTGIGLLPVMLWSGSLLVFSKSRCSLWKKLRHITGSTFCLLVSLMVMSYWMPWNGFWGIFTQGGLVPLSGSVGAALSGEGFQRMMFISMAGLTTFLLLSPPHLLRRIADWIRVLFNLIYNRIIDRVRTGTPSEIEPILPDNLSNETVWILPEIDVLDIEEETVTTDNEIREKAERIRCKLAEFCIEVEVPIKNVRTGPKVSVYGIRPGRGVRVSEIQAREEDLEVELGTKVRFEGINRTPGLIGLEVPNSSNRTVGLGELINNSNFLKTRQKGELPVAIGLDSGGEPVLVDLCSMPHLLIGGATNSGKSVFLNGILSSLLLFNKPSELRLLLIDPKQVEFRYYEDIPHLVPNDQPGNIIVDPHMAEQLLDSLQKDMLYRHQLLVDLKVRNIRDYNRRAEVTLPYLVVVIDELASLIHSAPGIKSKLVQVAQRGRAVGIQTIIATQRPEVQIIDGLIKAQFPSRVALTVASVRDSMTILDVGGAQKLLGQGDMLFKDVSNPDPIRVQGVYVHDHEIAGITGYWKSHSKDQPSSTVLQI